MKHADFIIWGVLFCFIAAVFPADKKTAAVKEEKSRYYKKWLDEDVAYIITEDEKTIFQKLTVDDERDHFIEQFWERRNPNPFLADNTFKSEHYRRIAYANEHFTSGKPGWKTDRGRIYILFGQPDEISHNPSGHVLNRDLNQGGGHTTTFPYETWFYRKIEGVGNGIEIEFVDSSLSGEYRMAISPEEKDALLYTTSAGATLLEQMGYETREDRIRGMGVKDVSGTMFRTGQLSQVFDRYQRFFQLRRPPEIQYKDLQQLVTTKIGYSLLPMDMTCNFRQLSPDMFLAPITLAIPSSTLVFKEGNDGVKRARVEIYGLVQSLAGRVVYEFEDTLTREQPVIIAGSKAPPVRCMYQRIIPLMAGRFKLTLVAKDAGSGNISVLNQSIYIPHPPEKGLSASSLIIGDNITPASRNESLTDPFVLEGSLKLFPNMTGTVRNGTSIANYVEFYNLGIDSRTLKPNWDVDVAFYHHGERVEIPDDSRSKIFPIFRADKLALCWMQTVRVPAVGDYELKVHLTDKITGDSISAGAVLKVQK